MNSDQVFEEVDRCCKALSDRLVNKKYFFDGYVVIYCAIDFE